MVDLSKRRFLSGKKRQDNELSLPWLSQPTLFIEQCTRCNKCVDVCQTQIIVKGDGGFPHIDFSNDECTFCYQCAAICPEPLFNPQSTHPWTAKATVKEDCLAKLNVDCRTCGDMCEPMAITFKLEVGKVAQPILNLEECNGCGACVSVCPTSSINVSNF
ncbi:ferredoxin-type protein NapF [Vibrio sp. T11.5]|uniref:ferredoxin-type protein NapF n=1 Tax=Vibrio sp. T11.5 TaxID=2998836 RepID=UPI0022CD539F|nr:ferredoxin-type protein NapF [Vibrio sp. T11.5]MDA0118484.1 ferredoxin-type protein NapF [Vibrio sp. T11.5]